MLPYGQRGEEQVVLVHVGRETEEGVVCGLAIHEDVAIKFLVPQRNAIEKARLAGALGKKGGREGEEVRQAAIWNMN